MADQALADLPSVHRLKRWSGNPTADPWSSDAPRNPVVRDAGGFAEAVAPVSPALAVPPPFPVLHSFSNYGRVGYRPMTGLVQGGGRQAVRHDRARQEAGELPQPTGVVHRISNTGAVTVLHTFTGPFRSTPYASPPTADGALHGTTFTGGSTGKGVAFRVF